MVVYSSTTTHSLSLLFFRQAAFMRQHRIEMNWRVAHLRPPRVLKGHDDHVITCLQFSGNTIVSGSDDNTLKVWNATSGKVSVAVGVACVVTCVVPVLPEMLLPV